ncbi:MAG: MMPL family transporter [Pseudomonadota bacterium]
MAVIDRFSRLHERLILRHPVVVLVCCAILVAIFGWQAQKFRLDASADSLTLAHDQSLRYYRFVTARYGSDDYLIVTFAPNVPLFGDAALDRLRALRDALAALDNIRSVVSILDVPLIQSPPVELRNFADGVRYLNDPNTDRALARDELLASAMYRDLLISKDANVTALRVDLDRDATYLSLRDRRDQLRELDYTGALTSAQARELDQVSVQFDAVSRNLVAREQQTIAAVRHVLAQYEDIATVHLGGVPMIVADSIDFIQHDLVTFGSAVIVFLIIILTIAFRKPRWAILSLANCAATCIVMLGILGLFDWRLTVVSSNFVSLLLILCLALTLHIIVRYRETHVKRPHAGQFELVREAVGHMVVPCFYTAVTTMIAFGSLLVSGIQPVIDFGWMMVIGLAIGFVFSFVLFPAGLMLFEPGEPRRQRDITAAITGFFARLIDGRIVATLVITVALTGAGIAGITRLTVENRFIDYYKQSTEIYQGMAVIDRQLGGTTPLDIIIDAPLGGSQDAPVQKVRTTDPVDDEFDDEFEDIFADDEQSGGITATSYWFNNPRLTEITRIHDYLDAMPETGKVISVATAGRLLAALDESVLSDNLMLSLVYQRLPDDVREALITPYLSPDGDQIRISLRVFESDPSLRRNALIERIGEGLTTEFGLAPEQVNLSGMLVLYNNMLQSLFRSQMLTLGAVFLAILLTFFALFRSLRIAAIAIVPNIISATLVLGLIGWLRIPLDLMTITIAAITVGIAVDDTIHYVHRFRRELAQDGSHWAAVHRCHRSIGRAMYYTSVTIMLGFSILALSQFNPTIYFGLLTGIAMIIALLANLTLLPVLLVRFAGEADARHAT